MVVVARALHDLNRISCSMASILHAVPRRILEVNDSKNHMDHHNLSRAGFIGLVIVHLVELEQVSIFKKKGLKSRKWENSTIVIKVGR